MWRRLRLRSSRDRHQPEVPAPTDDPVASGRDGHRPNEQRRKSSASSVPRDGARTLSTFSSFRGRSPGPEHRPADATGLHILYQPPYEPSLDIVLVHGLGGACRRTWSKFQDPQLFWPEQWLPLEPGICHARISTFGYNADVRYGSPDSISNIADFAKDLLFAMKFAKDDGKEDLRMGSKVPIIFVVHSMGGLVAKKAYLLGQNDENYQNIVKSISAMMFLATPHRGSDLAELLERILSVTFQSQKNFLVDLNKGSSALEELNEQFRHIAPKLSIISFYETLKTSIGPKKLMVLEKGSSILGYSGEVSAPLIADHHDVCKFTSQDDPNYVSVRNALKSLVDTARLKGVEVSGQSSPDETLSIEEVLGPDQAPEDDFDFFQQRHMLGTCQWIHSEAKFNSWLEEKLQPYIMWLNAPPASGKSILATYIIKHVRDAGHDCQFYYFRFGDQTKRSTSALLRSLGFQLARHNFEFRRTLAKLSQEGVRLEKKDARIIWQKLFVSVLSQMALTKPLYWVVDALDESESPKLLLNLLHSLSTSSAPIRVLVVSRNTEALSLAFQRLSLYVPVEVVEMTSQEHTSSDIKLYLKHEMNFMRGSEDFKQYIMRRMLERASGNFLWVYLVLEEISSCHTQQSIEQTLEEIPPGMESLYHRMEAAIAQNPKQADWTLARTLISWTMCAQRSLSLKELSQALLPEFPGLLNLQRTIREVCGCFLIVDQTSRVSLVHQSARDYLTKTPGLQISINPRASHEALFSKCIAFLSSPRMHLKLVREQSLISKTEPFLAYAAISWPYHLRQAHTGSGAILNILVKFFEEVSVLSWIHSLALLRHLEALVQAAHALTSTVGIHRRTNAEKSPLLHRLQDLELLSMWATDLLKIVGKFGKYLLQSPAVIYKKIPPFCPRSSVLHRQFNQNLKAELFISGVSNISWNDCLARMTLPRGVRAWTIKCAGRYIAVLSSIGTIFLWDSSSFEEIGTLSHKEHVTVMCFNSGCDRLVSYGVKTTKLWSIPSGELLSSTSNPTDAKAMAITFAENGTKIVIASDDRLLRHYCPSDNEGGWQNPNPTLIKDSTQIDGGFLTAPSHMAFSPDATQIAVAYRGYPLSVWCTKEPRLVGRCRRSTSTGIGHNRPSVSWMAVDRIVWNSVTGHLIGVYKDGSIFKWHPSEEETQEAQATADEIEISPDGRFFVTSDSRGVVKIWDFAYFCVIYQLSSEDLVNGLAFSPDGGRFYDLRGSSINAWEPNSLIRLSESEEAASETASEDRTLASMSQASESSVKPVDPICALAVAPRGCLYCVANDDGVVTLFERSNGRLLELIDSPSFLTIDHLTWGKDGHHVASADIGGNINVKRLELSKSTAALGEVKKHSILTTKAKPDFGAIHQILLSGDSARLLVLGQDTGQMWSLKTGRIQVGSTVANGKSRKWINHPLYENLIISIGPDDLRTFSWEDLSEVNSFAFHKTWPRLHGRSSLDSQEAEDTSLAHLTLGPSKIQYGVFVSNVVFTQDKEHLLVQTSEMSTQGKTTKGIFVLRISCLDESPGKGGSALIDTLYISGSVLMKIEMPLGILPGNRLVFLDQDLWMCTYKLDSGDRADGLKRHYFIPRDWVSTEALEQCCMLDDGTLLLPKDDEVAVIASALADPEW